MLNAVRRFIRTSLARVWPGQKISEAPGVVWSRQGSSAGVDVDVDGALSLSAVFASVRLLSSVIGSLPLQVYQRWGREKEQAVSHPAHRLLHLSPNPEMTSITFRGVLEWHRLLGGNAYAEIVWAGNGKPAALWPIEPWRVRPARREDGQLYYQVDGAREVEVEDMIHVPLVSSDGVTGRSFLDWAFESLGLGIATQSHAGAWFGNGARPGALLKTPQKLTDEQAKTFRRTWDERHKTGGTAVLWGGWEWVGTDGQVDPEKSQLVEQRRFTTEEVARWLGIPPHLLRDLNRATFSNIEQQNLDFLAYSLNPILVAYEQEYDRKLLSPPRTFSKHNVKGLLRGDAEHRSKFYKEMFMLGAMSPNEIRECEDDNPVDGGDTYFVPLNMASLTAVAFPDAPSQPAEKENTPDADPQPFLQPLLTSTLERLARVEANAIRRAAQKPGRFLDWLEGYYLAHQTRLTEALAPVIPLCSSKDPPESLARSWCLRSSEELLELSGRVGAKEFAGSVESLLNDWRDRPERMTQDILGEEACQKQ